MESKYFKVTCKCGHVGVKHFIKIAFPIMATSGKNAAKIARYLPRVKHNHKDAILECKEISYYEYMELENINNKDPYLLCGCKQEQEMIKDFSDRLELEPRFIKEKKKSKRDSLDYRMKRQTIRESEKWCIWEDEEEDICQYESYPY